MRIRSALQERRQKEMFAENERKTLAAIHKWNERGFNITVHGIVEDGNLGHWGIAGFCVNKLLREGVIEKRGKINGFQTYAVTGENLNG